MNIFTEIKGLNSTQIIRFIDIERASSVKFNPNIRLDYIVSYIDDRDATVEAKITLFNDNLDTVYFLTSSCDGIIYSVEYDTSKFEIEPMIYCNISYPIIEKIPPKGRLDFLAHFHSKEIKNRNIKLGFDFYEIDKSFDLNKISLQDIYRQSDEKTIKWGEYKKIE